MDGKIQGSEYSPPRNVSQFVIEDRKRCLLPNLFIGIPSDDDHIS